MKYEQRRVLLPDGVKGSEELQKALTKAGNRERRRKLLKNKEARREFRK